MLDTEGIGALNSCNIDAKIIILVLSLSSFLIYNSLNVIDESSMQDLAAVIDLAQHFD